ncbi:hypothetical protein COV16_00685 [Candidatus Woesearchaeota archaeon CG10_big_fil_rev_8_21_14_0_10_34_8]|nr:MAG: hypothetical protein COV16_00685 [Candidatus Woesearchaeota archaeon CG10_big_fil_rev_8_21_14_0_10_34_8]
MLNHYTTKKTEGIIKVSEELEKRKITIPTRDYERLWRSFCNADAVFSHNRLGDTFETFAHLNLPNTERSTRSEVILAKSHSRPVFIEFTPGGLGAMKLSSAELKYPKKPGNLFYPRFLTLD